MEKRISLELRGRKKSELESLDLSGAKTGGELEGLSEEFQNLTDLSLQNSSLTNIKLFPKLANLTRLDLSENRLSKGLEVLLDCPKLKYLLINENKFKELDSLEPLKNFKSLTHLDLAGNDFEDEDLKTKIFLMLPQLENLDGEDKDGNEAKSEGDDEDEEEDSDDEGEEEEESDEDDDGPGLSALYDNTGLLDEDDEEDFDAAGDVEGSDDDDLDEEEDEGQESQKGQKRKLEDAD